MADEPLVAAIPNEKDVPAHHRHRRALPWQRCELLACVHLLIGVPTYQCQARASTWLCRVLGRVPAPHKTATPESKAVDLINLQLKTAALAPDPITLVRSPTYGVREPKIVQVARNGLAGCRTGLDFTNWERYSVCPAYLRRLRDQDTCTRLIPQHQLMWLLGRDPAADNLPELDRLIHTAGVARGPEYLTLEDDPLNEFDPLRPYFKKITADPRFLLDPDVSLPPETWRWFARECAAVMADLESVFGSVWLPGKE